MNDIIKIINPIEDPGVLIDEITITVKHEIKNPKKQISWGFLSNFICFISATSSLFSSERYKWKRS